MTYVNAVKYLKAHTTGVPSPERMKLLCRYLGDPQRQMRFVHLAGSSGKTSCAIMLSTVLVECGYKIGRLTSPYTKEYREMISIDESILSHKEFADNVSKVVDAAKKMTADIEAAASLQGMADAEPTSHPKITKNLLDGKISPTPIASEIICAAAFLAFRKNDCNIAVLECGESRADPTSIIDPPLVSVICGSSFTDEQLRTSTGIIRKGTREVVSAAPAGIAYSTILDTCVKSGSRLTVPAHGELKINKASLGGKSFEYRGKSYSVPFCSSYQLLNALTTIETVYALRRTGVALHSQDVASGIASARIPLRFEVISAAPAIILDCAKTESDLVTFVNSLVEVERFIEKNIILVTAQDNKQISTEIFEQHGFSVISTLYCAGESEHKRIAARATSLSANEIMIILGTPNFVSDIKTAILRSFSYR